MEYILSFIVLDIIVLFPILSYYFFAIYNQNMKNEKKEIFFDIAIFISLFLVLNTNYNMPNHYKFIFSLLPLLISMINKKIITSIIISIILLEYTISYLDYNYILSIIFTILLFSIYYYYKHFNKETSYIINMSSILCFLLLITNLYSKENITTLLIESTICIITYIINIRILNLFINESNNIMHLHMTIKEFEKSKDFKNNLFKITHEVKNPLAVVKGYLDLFDVNNKDKSLKYIKIMKSEITRSLNLLDDFKEFSSLSINKELISINDLFDEIKDIMIPFFISNKVKYEFKIEENIKIYADYNRLKQVIINIIKNAVEACEKYKGHVLTTVFIENNNLLIYVKDNGIGMDSETLKRIKTPFYTTKENGTGLGTSLSTEIIKSHNGNLYYYSKASKGTTAKIIINNNMDNNLVLNNKQEHYMA